MMVNPIVTNNDIGSVVFSDPEFTNSLLTFAGAATIKAGTILARDSVSLKFVPFVKGGGVNENGIPKAIQISDVVAAGAGDEAVRPAISGKFVKERLIIDGDSPGDVNIDAKVLDQLRDFSMIAVNVNELNFLDNQP